MVSLGGGDNGDGGMVVQVVNSCTLGYLSISTQT